MLDVIVVGGGVNGLVAGALLARARLTTLILDRQPTAGGAAVMGDLAPGFRAPTLSHALGPVHAAVARSLRLDRANITFVTPDPALTTLGRDGQSLVFHRDLVLTAASIHRLSPVDAARWADFVKTLGRIAGVLAVSHRQVPPEIERPIARQWWQLLSLVRHARRLGHRDQTRLARWLPMSVADLLDEWFENDLLKAALAANAIFGTLAGPRSGGTGGRFLQRLADDPMPVGSGATAIGGPGALADGLVRIAERAGATVRPNARVVRILTVAGRAAGVVLENGEEIVAESVVSAVDPRQTFLSLIDQAALPPTFVQRMQHFRARGVTAKINLALSSAPVFPALAGDDLPLRGRLLIAPDLEFLERAYDAAKYGEPSGAPWLEISIPTFGDPTLAPAGQHVMSVYVHFAPRHLATTTWTEMGDALYRRVIGVLDAHAPGLEALILARQVITPEDLETFWGLSGGHIFHGEPALDQSWIARPLLGWARYVTPIDGLYLAGAGAHPGGGLTGLPGWLAAQALREDLRKK